MYTPSGFVFGFKHDDVKYIYVIVFNEKNPEAGEIKGDFGGHCFGRYSGFTRQWL